MAILSDKLLNPNIIKHLILHTSSMHRIGLFSGKMGVCIFFYRYSRHTGIKRYAGFANDLLDEIYRGINTESKSDFGDGLAGICWSIEYIVRHGFVKADTDEILVEIDSLILERDVRRIADTSLETGLEGLAHYVLARCVDKPNFPIDNMYIAELMSNLVKRGCCSKLATQLDDLLKGKKVEYKFELIDVITENNEYKGESLSKQTVLGFSKNGLAGSGIRWINES